MSFLLLDILLIKSIILNVCVSCHVNDKHYFVMGDRLFWSLISSIGIGSVMLRLQWKRHCNYRNRELLTLFHKISSFSHLFVFLIFLSKLIFLQFFQGVPESKWGTRTSRFHSWSKRGRGRRRGRWWRSWWRSR